jgi:hypothetical protein
MQYVFIILLAQQHKYYPTCSTTQPAGPTTNTARLLPRYEDKTKGCHCSH